MRRNALLDDFVTTLYIRLSKNGRFLLKPVLTGLTSSKRAGREVDGDREVGGDSRVRTGGLRLAKPALSQLSYIPSAADPGGPRKI
jgi:hypothetical protein